MPSAARTCNLLGVDIGNTAVKCAAFAGEWQLLARIETRPVDTLATRLTEALDREDLPRPLRCVAASVHPPADEAVVKAIWHATGANTEFLGKDVALPIDVNVREPARVGADRILCALGAREIAGAPCVVVSAGTAITVDFVDADGAFAGGAISPGFTTAARSLREQTALLPQIRPARPAQDVGADTEGAVTSGVFWFCAGGVLALVGRYRTMPGAEDAPVVVTGGDGELLLEALERYAPIHRPELVFVGMGIAAGA